MDLFTIVACLFIIVAFFVAWGFVAKTKVGELKNKRKWMEQLPSVISTLGVLGTFVGITRGLVSFDTATLDTSIPILLDGLKTAFFTSLLGMAGSLILNRVISKKFDMESEVSEPEKAARLIIDTLNGHHKEMPKMISDGNKDLVTTLASDDTVKIIRQDVEQLKDDVEELKGLAQEFRTILHDISSSNAVLVEEFSQLRAVAVTATASISAMDNNVDEIQVAVSNIDKNTQEMSDRISMGLGDEESTLTTISNDIDEIRTAVEDIGSRMENQGNDEEGF